MSENTYQDQEWVVVGPDLRRSESPHVAGHNRGRLPMSRRATTEKHADMYYSENICEYTDSQSRLAAVCPARTTFYAKEATKNDNNRGVDFDVLWKLNTGRGHTYESKSPGKTTTRDDATWKRCDAILQSCHVPDLERKRALSDTLGRNLNGFSRYYEGADGACVGFALLACHQKPEKAKLSTIAELASEVVPGLSQDDVMSLIDYVFRKYGSRNR